MIKLKDHDCEDNLQEYTLGLWNDEFRPVAQRLLERIQKYQSKFDPI